MVVGFKGKCRSCPQWPECVKQWALNLQLDRPYNSSSSIKNFVRQSSEREIEAVEIESPSSVYTPKTKRK